MGFRVDSGCKWRIIDFVIRIKCGSQGLYYFSAHTQSVERWVLVSTRKNCHREMCFYMGNLDTFSTSLVRPNTVWIGFSLYHQGNARNFPNHLEFLITMFSKVVSSAVSYNFAGHTCPNKPILGGLIVWNVEECRGFQPITWWTVRKFLFLTWAKMCPMILQICQGCSIAHSIWINFAPSLRGAEKIVT